MNQIQQGWFTEVGTLWPGQGLSLKVKDVLYNKKSEFQDIVVFDSESDFGRVLLLDGVIQCTEKDEFSYQEMITHLPLHGLETEPKKVLVVGGGDGGVLRELSRYQSIKEIHLAEIDGDVIEVSKRFFPQMAIGFNDPRLQVHVLDGMKYIAEQEENSFDAIIVDSSDPVGPAEVLFKKPFFEALHKVVKPGGIICTQAETIWLMIDIIKELSQVCKEVFVGGSISYAYTTIPTYPSGQIGFMLCAKQKQDKQQLNPIIAQQRSLVQQSGIQQLRYYNQDIHKAAFVLPQFAKQELQGLLSFQ